MEFRELARINGGYAEARILQTAVTLGFFDQLDLAGRPAAAIAVAAGTNTRATELLLNALVAMRLIRKDGDLFKETEVSRIYLTSGSPTSYQGFVRFDASLWSLWGNLAETVRTGKPAREPDMFQSSTEDTADFISPDNVIEVEGSGGVTLVDASGIEFSSMDQVAEGEPVCMLGVRLHLLVAGARFDLATRTASPGTLARGTGSTGTA